MMIFCGTVLITLITDFYVKKKEEQAFIQQFVPVKMIKQEIYKGNTLYILEAKGERFEVSPFKYPDVRDINPNTQVKVIFGDDNIHHLKTVEMI